MKSIFKLGILMCLLTLSTICANAQTSKKMVDYNPYLSVGTTLSSGQLGYGGEVGIYSSKVWYAVGVSTVDVPRVDNPWYASFKSYYRIFKEGFVDTYAYAGINMHLARDKALSFEPGAAVVFNISDRLAPQLSLTFPIQENTLSVWKPLTMNLGLSLNFWLH